MSVALILAALCSKPVFSPKEGYMALKEKFISIASACTREEVVRSTQAAEARWYGLRRGERWSPLTAVEWALLDACYRDGETGWMGDDMLVLLDERSRT